MLDGARRVLDVNIRKGVGAAFGTDEKRIALGKISRARRGFLDLHAAAVIIHRDTG